MRGDANMSDSSFMKSQKIVSKKLKKSIDKLDKEYRMRELRHRWESGKIETKTLWQKFKEVLNVVFRNDNNS